MNRDLQQENQAEYDGQGQAPDEAQEPLTCSVREFASILGISRDRAYELVHSSFPPPGFKVGKGYRIIRSKIPEYMDQLYERELATRDRRW